VAAVVGVLFITAFAAVPEFRRGTMNLILEVSDVATSLSVSGSSHPAEPRGDLPSTTEGGVILLGYQFPDVPDDFKEIKSDLTSQIVTWVEYQNQDGDTIRYAVTSAQGTSYSVDTEGAETAERIQIHGFDGLLVEKAGRVDVLWLDISHDAFVTVSCHGIELSTVWSYAEAVEFVGEA
jgi:hypothetical protein